MMRFAQFIRKNYQTIIIATVIGGLLLGLWTTAPGKAVQRYSQALTFLMILFISLTITPRQFAMAVRQPGAVVAGLGLNFVYMPLLCWVLARLLVLTADMDVLAFTETVSPSRNQRPGVNPTQLSSWKTTAGERCGCDAGIICTLFKMRRQNSVSSVESHLEREKHAKPLWLAYQPPPDQSPGDQSMVDLWRGYQYRWPVEPSICFRKHYLNWTLPRFQEPERCDRWTMLVSLAQWQLFLARDWVQDNPLPWQPAQEELTPERVLQGLEWLFSKIGTPAAPPQTRGKSPGWPKGRPRTRRERQSGQKDQEQSQSSLKSVRNSTF